MGTTRRTRPARAAKSFRSRVACRRIHRRARPHGCFAKQRDADGAAGDADAGFRRDARAWRLSPPTSERLRQDHRALIPVTKRALSDAGIVWPHPAPPPGALHSALLSDLPDRRRRPRALHRRTPGHGGRRTGARHHEAPPSLARRRPVAPPYRHHARPVVVRMHRSGSSPAPQPCGEPAACRHPSPLAEAAAAVARIGPGALRWRRPDEEMATADPDPCRHADEAVHRPAPPCRPIKLGLLNATELSYRHGPVRTT